MIQKKNGSYKTNGVKYNGLHRVKSANDCQSPPSYLWFNESCDLLLHSSKGY